MTNPTHPQQVAKSTSAKKVLMSDLMQTVGILPILILIVAVFGFIAPNFFTESNLLNITRQASINIVLAAGMTFIILTGGIDLSVGSILGTTAVAAMVVSLIPEFAMAKRQPLYDEFAELLLGIEEAIADTVAGQMRIFGSAGQA